MDILIRKIQDMSGSKDSDTILCTFRAFFKGKTLNVCRRRHASLVTASTHLLPDHILSHATALIA